MTPRAALGLVAVPILLGCGYAFVFAMGLVAVPAGSVWDLLKEKRCPVKR